MATVSVSDVTEKIEAVKKDRNEAIKSRDAKQAELDALLSAIPEDKRSSVKMITDSYESEIASFNEKIERYTERIGAFEKNARTLEVIEPLIDRFGTFKVDANLVSGNVTLATLEETRNTKRSQIEKINAEVKTLDRLAKVVEDLQKNETIKAEDIANISALTFVPTEDKSGVTLGVATSGGSGSGRTRSGSRRNTITEAPDNRTDWIGRKIGSKDFESEGGFASFQKVVDDLKENGTADEQEKITKMSTIQSGANAGKPRSVSARIVLESLGFKFEPIVGEAIADDTEPEEGDDNSDE